MSSSQSTFLSLCILCLSSSLSISISPSACSSCMSSAVCLSLSVQFHSLSLSPFVSPSFSLCPSWIFLHIYITMISVVLSIPNYLSLPSLSLLSHFISCAEHTPRSCPTAFSLAADHSQPDSALQVMRHVPITFTNYFTLASNISRLWLISVAMCCTEIGDWTWAFTPLLSQRYCLTLCTSPKG